MGGDKMSEPQMNADGVMNHDARPGPNVAGFCLG